MEESDLRAFRDRWRLNLLERLVLRAALTEPVLRDHLSVADSQQALKDWLDKNSAVADAVYGETLGDPALVALFADEVKELVERMKTRVDKMAAEMNLLMRGT